MSDEEMDVLDEMFRIIFRVLGFAIAIAIVAKLFGVNPSSLAKTVSSPDVLIAIAR